MKTMVTTMFRWFLLEIKIQLMLIQSFGCKALPSSYAYEDDFATFLRMSRAKIASGFTTAQSKKCENEQKWEFEIW